MPAPVLEISPEFIPKVQFLFEPWRYKVLYGGRAGVKCLAKGTHVLTFSGELIPVEKVQVGDQLMGPDSMPRTVQAVTSGRAQLYTVKQAGAMDYVVNEDHILSLRKTHASYYRADRGGKLQTRCKNEPDIVNISIKEYLKKSPKWRSHFFGYKADCIHFAPQEELPIHPYFLGFWLGDGTSRELAITCAKTDREVYSWLGEYVESTFGNGMTLSAKPGINAYSIYFPKTTGNTNELWQRFKALGLPNDKHIPHQYQTASEEDRLELLAGLIDSDGTCHNNGFSFSNVNKELAQAVKRLADFLGFRTAIHVHRIAGVPRAYRVSIGGSVWRIPCKLPRKQVRREDTKSLKNPLISQLTVLPAGESEFYGFSVDRDHLFLLQDGTVTHNSWSVARALLILGLSGQERVLCGRELQKSLDESVHKLLADQISALGMNYLYEVQQAHIVGRESAQGTLFSFEGIRHNTAKVKSYEGLTRCWIEEAAKLSKASFNIIVPTLRLQGSELWLTYNPELDDDFVHQFFVIQQAPPNAKVCRLTYHDNPWLSATTREDIQHLKETDYDEYLHVYEGHTRQVLEGAVFADEMREAIAQERITKVPYTRGVPVQVYFDLGRSDHTSMWFVQQIGFEYHVIDFYQNRLKHIEHYLKVMQERGYFYGLVWLPHDAVALTLGTKMSIQEQVKGANFDVRIVPKLKITDRLNAARTVFPLCYFDEQRCHEGLHSLKHYKYSVKDGKFSAEPLHDWASDAADAFCYFGVASKQRVRSAPCGLELPESTRVGTLGELFTGAFWGERKSNGWLGR